MYTREDHGKYLGNSNFLQIATRTKRSYREISRPSLGVHTRRTRALLRHAPRLLVTRPHELIINQAVHRDYSSSGLHRLYCAYVVHPDVSSHRSTSRQSVALDLTVRPSSRRSTSRRSVALALTVRPPSRRSTSRRSVALALTVRPSSRRSTSRRSVALALAVRPVTASRGVTTHRPDCTGSIAPMSCIRTRRLAARLLVGRSHWLSPCVRRLAARLLVGRSH
jgi:hypothetical protein